MQIKMCKEFYYRLQPGDDIYKKFGITKDNVIRNNPDIDLYPGEWVKITLNDYKTHIVKPMETLEIIAKKYCLTIDKIKYDNNLVSDKLFIGQLIKIKE